MVAVAGRLNSIGWASLDRIAAWQRVQPTGDNLVDDGCDLAGVDLLLGVDLEAIRQRSTRLANSAVVHGIQKDARLPTVDEIPVESVASGVTHSKDPGVIILGVKAIEWPNIEPELDKDMWHNVRMGLWAVATIGVVAHWVGHMSIRVVDVESVTVPAVREVNAAGEAIVTVGEAGEAGADFIRRTVAEPFGDGFALRGGRHGAKRRIASDHAEVLWELLNGLI